MVKTDYKNLTGFLMTKDLNRRQVRQAEMLVEYYFSIVYTKGTENARADTLSRMADLLDIQGILGAILRMDQDGSIKYNYLQIISTYDELIVEWNVRIQKAQLYKLELEEYIN